MKLLLNAIALLFQVATLSTAVKAQSHRSEKDNNTATPPAATWHRPVNADEPYTEVAKAPGPAIAAWYKYYSLAEASMDIGDTSTAIMYYHQAVNLNESDTVRYRQLQQLEKYYLIPERSFYLKSY